jgi:Tfp pilus assembly protein PilX
MQSAKNRSIGRRTAERGAVLMVVLIAMVALLGLGMTGLFLTSGSIQMNTNINLRNQALLVAEAGVERARDVLNNPGWIPPVSVLLKGANASIDEVPQSASDADKCLRSLPTATPAPSPPHAP